MSPLILSAVIAYSEPDGTELWCDAIVICRDEHGCNAYPLERCAGHYDAERDRLWGSWSLAQCLNSSVLIRGNAVPTLGCMPDLGELDLDRDTMKGIKP